LDFHIENAYYDDDDDGPSETFSQSPYNCNICGRRNSNWGDLRSHLKMMHPESVRPCKFFLLGKCDFPENICWFMHTKPSTTSSPQTLTEYKCGICEKTFHQKTDFMNHRKQEHVQFVPECKEYVNGACRFEKNGCWFRHCEVESAQAKMKEDEPSMMDRLFKMMEQFTERINNIENQL
jgi:DNA-directed RNA polymerase subunit RPC12/RpoP